MRALGLTQYRAVLLLDSDVAVTGSLAPLFALPAEFAAVWDQSKWLGRWAASAGGRGWGGKWGVGPRRRSAAAAAAAGCWLPLLLAHS